MPRLTTPPRIPKAHLHFGQRVLCNHGGGDSPPFVATVTGVNYDHRRDREVLYTLTEDDGAQSDGWGSMYLNPIS